MRHFCTYFDSNYLLRGLTLYRSLEHSGCDFRLYVLALDESCFETLARLGLSRLVPIALPEIEASNPDLLTAKANRSVVEYYFTLSPMLPLHVLKHWPDLDIITYLDADLFFYRSPEPLFEELGDQSILITEHRFPEYLRDKEKFGRYNVQYQSFRRDEQGLACLERWSAQCIEWCFDRLEDGRFADQKYLEEWPERYSRVAVSQLKGAGVAPWNWATFPMQLADGRVTVGGEALIFYHFHGLKILRPWLISNGLVDFGMMPGLLRRHLYAGYVKELRTTRRWLCHQGMEAPLPQDRFRRHKLGSVATLGEVARKAWSQLMLVP